MSHSASVAADKGIVVVCSAGNSGRSAWKKVTPPGASENVITVGALTKELKNAEFSSIGDTSDGRVKPDVMAIGVNSVVSGNDGTVSKANGTRLHRQPCVVLSLVYGRLVHGSLPRK